MNVQTRVLITLSAGVFSFTAFLLWQKKQTELELQNVKAQQAEQDARYENPPENDPWHSTGAGRLCARYPDWPRAACESIMKSRVHVGMTEEHVVMAWGLPTSINRSIRSSGVQEQWVYKRYRSYLYFENGILKSIQQSF